MGPRYSVVNPKGEGVVTENIEEEDESLSKTVLTGWERVVFTFLAKKKGLVSIDATCPDVTVTHDLIAENYTRVIQAPKETQFV